jgi:hypothetical protein
MKKLPSNRAKLSNAYVKAMTTMFFDFAMEITEITNFLGNCQWNLWLHHFYVLIFFLLKRQGNGGKFGKR